MTDPEIPQQIPHEVLNIAPELMDEAQKIDAALELANEFGAIDGGHHKSWVIDQMVRVLTGCPFHPDVAIDARGKPYTFDTLGESDSYKLFRERHDAEAVMFEWDEGVAP